MFQHLNANPPNKLKAIFSIKIKIKKKINDRKLNNTLEKFIMVYILN